MRMMRSLNGKASTMRTKDPLVPVSPFKMILVEPIRHVKVQQTYLSGRNPLRCFWYGKRDRGRWIAAYRVTEGMKHNWYRRHGKSIPKHSPLMPPQMPSVVSGLMWSMKARKEAELVQETYGGHHHSHGHHKTKAIVSLDAPVMHAHSESAVPLASHHLFEPGVIFTASGHSLPMDIAPIILHHAHISTTVSERTSVHHMVHSRHEDTPQHVTRVPESPGHLEYSRMDNPTVVSEHHTGHHHHGHHSEGHHHRHHTDHHSHGHHHHSGGHHSSGHHFKATAPPQFWFDALGLNRQLDMIIKGSGKHRLRPVSFMPLRETVLKNPIVNIQSDTPSSSSTTGPEQIVKHVGYFSYAKKKEFQLKIAQGSEAVPPQ